MYLDVWLAQGECKLISDRIELGLRSFEGSSNRRVEPLFKIYTEQGTD